jgi:hypothetical protein
MYEKQMSHAANTNKRDDLTTGHMTQIVEIALISHIIPMLVIVCNKSIMTGATSREGNAYPFRALEFTTGL